MDLDGLSLHRLLELSERAAPKPWVSMVEGRDHVSGDSFIMMGVGADRSEDLYLTCDSGPAGRDLLDLVAAARNYMPELINEVLRLREGSQ